MEQRGDTLNAPMITITCSSPMPDVIRVKIGHFLGERPRHPNFAITPGAAPQVHIKNHEDELSLTSGELTARFDRGTDWRLSFEAGVEAL